MEITGKLWFLLFANSPFSDQLRIPEIKYVIPLLSNINFSEPGKKRGSFFVDYKLAYCSI